ncbi:MAG: hypothetical protein ACFCVG_10480 [Kineosporiaceae bacterium]
MASAARSAMTPPSGAEDDLEQRGAGLRAAWTRAPTSVSQSGRSHSERTSQQAPHGALASVTRWRAADGWVVTVSVVAGFGSSITS